MCIRDSSYSGYEVVTAPDGVAALAQLSAARPDAVIMDVMMPRLDGLETTRMLRSSGNDVPIPVSYTHLDVYKRQAVDSLWPICEPDGSR